MAAQRNVNQPVVLSSTSIRFTVNNLRHQVPVNHQAQRLGDGHIQHLRVGNCLFLPTCLTLAECLARPCDKDGHYLFPGSHPPPREPLDATPENPYHPFEDRLAFEFADFHFSEQQSSQRHIDYALELLMAQAAKNHVDDDVPWKSASNMYTTIDQIQQGSNPWKTTPFRYQGPLPSNPLKWMTRSYDLVARDIRSVLHTQIACTDFDGHWDYVPFREFNNDGDRVWTNLMSGEWAATQAVRLPLVSIPI